MINSAENLHLLFNPLSHFLFSMLGSTKSFRFLHLRLETQRYRSIVVYQGLIFSKFSVVHFTGWTSRTPFCHCHIHLPRCMWPLHQGHISACHVLRHQAI